MSPKASFNCCGFAFAMAVGVVAVYAVFAPSWSLAQTEPAGSTTSVQHGTEKAREMKEPSFQTREERLSAKPLDWNSTTGTPTPRALTAKEKKALENAKRGSSAGGAPHPKAEAEARKLHPDDWK